MIKLKKEKLITRETAASDRRRAIVVELHPLYCKVRVKATRESHDVGWDAVLELGRKLDMLEQRKRA